MAHVIFKPCSTRDESAIIDFLWSIKDELLLTEKNDAAQITQILFEKGGVLAGYHNEKMVTMVGYFIGEPAQNYANKDLGFIYVTGIAKAHRLSRIMWNGLGYMVRHLHSLGIKEIRCHAGVHDPYTNRLYSHFAKRLGEDVTLRGRPAILYGNTVEGVLTYLDKGKARQNREVAPTSAEPTGTLWHCSPCNMWWLSNASSSRESWRLERLPEIDLTTVGTHPNTHADKAPAWNISGPSPLFCPECGTTMQTQAASSQAASTQATTGQSASTQENASSVQSH